MLWFTAPALADAVPCVSWEPHLTIVRHVLHGRWQDLRDMDLRQYANDDAFCLYAAQQHVAHYILDRIVAENQLSLFPDQWVAALRAEVARRAEVVDRLPGALADVVTAFTESGVDCRVLKGLPFAAKHFGGVAARRLVDLDLLVRLRDVNRALRVLWDMGYRCGPRYVTTTGTGLTIRKHRLRTDHALTLTRDRIHVDLHWCLRMAPAYRWDESDVWADSQEVRVNDVTCPVLSDEYALVLLLPSIASDIGRGACRLKHLLDVYQLLRREAEHFDWLRFFEARRSQNILKITVNVLEIVLDVFACRHQFPQLVDALQPQRSLHVLRSSAESLELVHRRGRNVANAMWFVQVYPVVWVRDAIWLIDRNVSHPGRLYVSLYRAIRFVIRWTWYVIRQRFTRRGPSHEHIC